MKTTMKKLVFAALAALACAVVPSSAAAAVGDSCTLGIYIDPSLEAGTLSVSPSGPSTVGQTVTLSAVAKHGYTFAWWEKTFAGEHSVNYQSSFSFVLEGDCEWEAVFRKDGEYFVFVQKPVGDITADPLLSTYAPGTNVTLIATPRIGHSIVYETAQDVGPDGTKTWTRLSGNTFTMPAHDIWVQALYSINIATSGDEHGTVALSHAGPYYEGDTVTLILTPDSGYRATTIYGVPEDIIVSGNTVTFTLRNYDDLDIHVDFEKIPTYTLHTSVYPPDGGTVAVTYDGANGNYVATATPTNGYHFLGWINLDDSSFLGTDNPYPLHVTGDMSIRAVFCVNVAVKPNIEHGSLEVVNSNQTYVAGDIVTLLGHPDEGYAVDYYAAGEIHNGSASLQRLDGNSFVMPPWDMLVSVVFVQGLTVSAAASTEGTGTVVGTGTYKPGSTVTLVAEPAEGYTFTSWEEDGVVVSTDRIYSFTIQTNRNLTANFQSYNGMSFTINASAVPAAGGTITGTGTYAGGQTVTLTAVPAPGYSFLGWSEYGQPIGTQPVYSFTANGNRTLTATFQSTVGITYVNAAGSELLCENFTTISSATAAMNTGWYAVVGNVTIANRIEISGAVNLILCDGVSLTVPNGIHLTGANSLTIWGQSGGTGALVIESPDLDQAGIGGNARQSGGVFTMNGGTLTATGGEYGAGIGGGGDIRTTADSLSNSASAGAITINGGTVLASGGLFAAGIGGGMQSGTGDITINGGTVVATGGDGGGSGIGGGWFGGDGTVTINGGTITATAGQKCRECYDCGAGIGGGNGRYLRSVVISGGDITAVGGYRSAGIGGGSSRHFASELENGKTLEELESKGTAYVTGAVTISGGTISATGGEQASGIGGGGFAPGGTVTISGGRVTANGGQYGAGIGGGWEGGGGTVAIRDGEVTATGGQYGAGIGAGYEASGGMVEIGGGTVAANGGTCAAGIGGGSNTTFDNSTNCGGGTVVITGGTVTATGGNGGRLEYPWPEIYGAGAGIGGGWRGPGANVTINGASITVIPGDMPNGGSHPQAIGHGSDASEDGSLILAAVDGSCIKAGRVFSDGHVEWSAEDTASACRNELYTTIIECGFLHSYDSVGHCHVCGDASGPVLCRIPRVNAEGEAQGSDELCESLTASSISWNIAGACSGWYAVTNDIMISSRVTVSGNVNIILCDGATLTTPKGIEVAEGNSLTIWRQEGATGVLLTGTTNGTDATCDSGNAAIGGGSGCNAGAITVNGGNVTAVAGAGAQAIGHGAGANGAGELHIHRTRVFDGVAAAEPVGHAQRDAVCRGSWARLADCMEHTYENHICRYCDLHLPVDYLNPISEDVLRIEEFSAFTGQAALSEGWYLMSTADVETSGRVTVSGNVNIIIGDGVTWNALSGINVGAGSSLTVWAQSEGDSMGALIATGASGQAGIGGGVNEAGGAVTINGGAVSVVGGNNASGIGGGENGDGGNFTIRGGALTVIAGTGAQAVGHGVGADAEGGIVIYHRRVYAAEAAANPVALAERETVCRSAWARLTPCLEHDFDNAVCRLCGKPGTNLYFDPMDADEPYKNQEVITLYDGRLDLNAGWYVLDESMEVGGRINISGDVNLILCDGVELTVSGGIHVAGKHRFTLWAQSEDSDTRGVLNALNPSSSSAGIGGNNLESAGTVIINGCTVNAFGGRYGAGIGGGYQGKGGTIVINGGSVNAIGGWLAAGIGGGIQGDGGTVTINGGTVNAAGGTAGAGIGGGRDSAGGTITINGGTVNATGGHNAAGIGGGSDSATGGVVNISGGIVTVVAGNGAQAIGRGKGNGNSGQLNIGASRVGRLDGSGSVVEWAAFSSRVDVCRDATGSTVRIAPCESHVDNDSDGFCELCRIYLLYPNQRTVEYLDSANNDQLDRKICSLYAGQAIMRDGWYAVTESQLFDGRLEIAGNVNLVLCDGAELSVPGGIHVAAGNSLTIWSSSVDNSMAGKLTITEPALGNAGVGGNAGESGGSVAVKGGILVVGGGEGAPAIGCGGGGANPGNLNLSAACRVGRVDGSGNVGNWATPASRVELCRNADGAIVRIERCNPHRDDNDDGSCELCGGHVMKTMPYLDPTSGDMLSRTDYSIYTGQQTLNTGWYAVDQSRQLGNRLEINGDVNLILCDGVELTLTSGIHVTGASSLTVWAQSEDDDTCGALTAVSPGDLMAGIGGNMFESGGEVTINGGRVSATGNYCGAGIGSSNNAYGSGGTITINGGTVSATGGEWAAGIGGAWESSGGTITINGGTVMATGGYFYSSPTYYCGAGIGAAYIGNGGNITINGGTVKAVGAYLCPGIGGGNKGGGGTITITGGTVTAIGDGTEAIGAGAESGDSGTLAIFGMRVGMVDGENNVTWVALENQLSACRNRSQTKVRLERCPDHEFMDGTCILCGASQPLDQFLQGVGSLDDPYRIASGDDWNRLAKAISFGNDTAGLHFRQTTDLSVTNTLGNEYAPFRGIYDGGGHTLTVNYDDTSRSFLAPFPAISGATISSLRVEGTVNGKIYCSGLVGRAVGGPNTIRDCVVGASVSATDGYAGGVIGHGMSYRTTIEGCAFVGNMSGVNVVTLWGWSDNAVAVLANCLDLSDSGFPVGLGGGTISVTRVGYVNPDKTAGSAGTWSADKRGVLVHSVTPGADVGLALSGTGQRYDTAGLTTCGDAFLVNGILYAGAGRTVSLALEYVGSNEFEIYSASAGTLSGSTGRYTLTMPNPGQDVTILARCKSTYYDPIRGTNVQIPDGAQVYAEGQTSLSGGWHFVTNSVTTSDRIIVTGEANLVLYDGVELNAMSGITVAEGARLTIWGQEGEHAVPGTAVKTRGTGTLFAQTPASGDYRQAAAIGGENGGPTGDIVINGGVVTARGAWGAGIGRGNIASGAVGSVTINGGYVDASGDSGSAGIGSGAYADSCPVTITGGYVLAAGCVYGSQATSGIGTGRPRTNGSQPLSNGTITITGGTVVAQAGEAPSGGTTAQAIGVNAADAANNGTGHLVLGDVRVYASADAASPVAVSARGDTCRGTYVKVEACARHQDQNADNLCDYCGEYCGPVPPIDANGVFLIGSTDDWNVFAASVAAGKRYDGETVQLTANIAVTTTVGTGDHPFGGIFDGCGHTLTVAIESTGTWAAPFVYIDGATISNLTVTGSVTGGGNHAAGLVGACGASSPNIIRSCTVAVDVVAAGTGYAGGIVGQGADSTLSFEGCVFCGSVSGFSAFAGGLLGWGNTMALTITNCLCTGAFTPSGAGKFHPIACKFANRTVTATVADAYYLNTIIPTVLGVNPTVATSNLIPGAEGTPVSATLVAGEWSQPVTAADGNEYYGWTTAPAGRLIASYTFDDAGNGGANLLHAAVGQDAIVRATRTTPVAGIGEIAAVTDAAILSGLSAGDGAVSIPNGQHLAVPVPAALLSAHGRPYTVVIKIRVPNTVGWRSLLNMPASNDTDAMVYLQQTTRNIYLKQFDKSSGAGIAASNGNVAADQWTTIAFAFGENTTDVYRDGTHVMHTTGALANSYADCAAAGGYILVGADDSGDDDLFYLSDLRIYEGAVSVARILPGSGTSRDPYTITSSADWDTFAANVNAGVDAAACYRLADDIAVTSMVGTAGQPFRGVFHGADHTLTVNINSDEAYASPFRQIDGAVIMNLAVDGTVTSSAYHASGLVGNCGSGNPNIIHNCVVAVVVSGAPYAGGIVGHGGHGTLTTEGCVFAGTMSGFANYAGGILGWCDALTLTITNCICAGTFAPTGSGKYHPIACKYEVETVAATVDRAYYLNTITPTETGANLISGAEGTPVSETYVAGEWTRPVTAADGFTYYAAATGYETWAAANGVTGAWDATDASGVHNVFRYLFDKPSGAFENPPILSISFDASGRAVIHTPPLSPSATGFDISILATDDLAGTGATTYPLDVDGETTIPASDKPARFFRLRAVEK